MDGTVALRQPDEEKPLFNRGALYAMYLDVACRILFPVIFAIFNVIYWVHYLNIGDYMNGSEGGHYTPHSLVSHNATLQMSQKT